jgi:hypothetical protein
VFLRVARCFFNRERGVGAFAQAYADGTFAVTDNHRNAKAEATTAGDDASNAANSNHFIIKLGTHAFTAWSAASTAIATCPAASVTATMAAPRPAAITALETARARCVRRRC